MAVRPPPARDREARKAGSAARLGLFRIYNRIAARAAFGRVGGLRRPLRKIGPRVRLKPDPQRQA